LPSWRQPEIFFGKNGVCEKGTASALDLHRDVASAAGTKPVYCRASGNSAFPGMPRINK
jgi:hypothetical protein